MRPKNLARKGPENLVPVALSPHNARCLAFFLDSPVNLVHWQHFFRAYFFEKLKQPERAMTEYRMALAAQPNFARAHACLGALYAKDQHLALAIEHFQTAARLAPKDADMFYNLGYLLDQNGQHQAAVEAFNEAVAKNRKLDRAWYGLGHAHAKLGQHREALQAIQEACLLQPRNGHLWYTAAMAHFALGERDKVESVIMHLHRIDPINCRRVIQEADRPDLAHLVKDLRV